MTREKTPLLRASIALNILLAGLLAVGVWFGLAFRDRLESMQENRQARYSAEKHSVFAASRLERADVVFLGDSITDAGAWDEYYPGLIVVNRGVSSDTAERLGDRLDDVVRLQPRKLFLMIGVNDISSGRSLAEIMADYSAILERLTSDLPETELYVQSVLPVDADFFVPGVNPRVDALNLWLKEEAEARGYTYLDVRSLFERQDGTLDRKFSPDGLHLSGEAYARWRDYLLPFVQEQ